MHWSSPQPLDPHPLDNEEGQAMFKPINRRDFVVFGAASMPALTALGQDNFPSKTVRIVVPVPPGASTDTIARHLAQRLGSKLNQTVIVDNRAGGAGGNVGSESVANAEPDGHTLLFAAAGPLAINKVLYPKLGYDPSRWARISLVATIDNALVVRPDAPFKTVPELIKYARSNPGKLNYASGGSGTTAHLAGELFKSMAGTFITHVPYRGSAAALNGFMQGQIDLMFVELAAASQHIQAGRLRLLAMGTKQRSSAQPNVPTVAETLPGFFVTVWFGLVAPPNTPPTLTAKLSAVVAEVMKSPDMVSTLQGLSITPVGSSPQEFQRFTEDEVQRWGKVIRDAKIAVD
jgi:tripartite-type tricarboxylate transporter receptor subunit TctC